jgi:nucleotide-binding universal stress UspA family protein
MSYKTILVHADLSLHAGARIRLAAAIARAQEAHLVGAAMTGISRFVYSDSGIDLERSVVAGYVDALHEYARQALEQFEAIAREAGVRSFEPRLVGDDPEGGLVLLSRFADLVVLSQTDPGHQVPGVVRDLPEYVMLNVARPVLIVPYAGQYERFDGKALVAWDASLEASRALGNALPLLRHASSVTVAQFNAGNDAGVAAESADLVAWLGRHGIGAQVLQQRTAIDEGNALLSLAADRQAGLIVMGGYGHTRFRELLLGGVTKTVLECMTAPVLMSH